jgi:hypothetical protein
MRTRLGVPVVLLTITACGGTATTSTVAPPTTSPPATTATVPTTTPETSVDGPIISVTGGTTWYSPDGRFEVSGTVDRHAEVSIEDAEVVAETLADGSTRWSARLERAEGTSEVAVVAQDGTGRQSEVTLSLIVDPTLELELAYVGGVEDGVVSADYVQWFTGEEANVAAREDGAILEDETVPNDYYIRNDNPQIRQLALAQAAPIVLQACFDPGPCVTTVGVTAEEWTELVGGGAPDGWTWYGGGALPFWLTLRDGDIVQVVEQYLP